jgi:Transposase DDE domain
MADTSGNAESAAAVEGLKFFRRLEPLLERLRPAQCERDRAGNRRLFFDHVCALILLTFFNPSLKTLRDLQRASRLATVRRKLGCSQASLGSLSEAMHLFDPELLPPIVQQLLDQIPHSPTADPRLKDLAHIPTAVDGTLLRQLPQITQACFDTRQDRGWKLHTHFEVLRGVPTFARLTDASGQGAASEKAVLKASLSGDRCYIVDRGYEEFALFNAILAARSSYVCRVRNDHHFQRETLREVPAEAATTGVLEDAVGRMGSPKSQRIEHPDHTQRRIVVRVTLHPKRGGRRRTAASQDIVLVTNLLDVPVEIVVLLYRFRWLIELFFRWLKCVLSCRHLLSQDPRGIQIQMYCALIACLLIQLACPIQPNQWTYKLLCLYQQGWATEEEVLEHLRQCAEAGKQPQ